MVRKNVRGAVSLMGVLLLFLWSGCHNAATGDKAPEPRQVQNIQVYPSADGVVLKWDSLEDPKKVSGYLVEYRELGSSQWTPVNEKNGFSGNVNSLKDTVSMKAALPLTPSREYEFQVKAFSSDGNILAINPTGNLAEQEIYDMNGDGRLSKTNQLRYPDPVTLGVGPVTDLSIQSVTADAIKIRWREPIPNNNTVNNYIVEYLDGLNDLNGDGNVDNKDYVLNLKNSSKEFKNILTVPYAAGIVSAVLGKTQGFSPIPGRVYVFRIVSQYTRDSKTLRSEQGVPYFFRPGYSPYSAKDSFKALELNAFVAASPKKPVALSKNEIYLTWFNFYEKALKYNIEYRKAGESTASHLSADGTSSSLKIENLEEAASYHIRIVAISGSTDPGSMLYTENVAELPRVSLNPDFLFSYNNISANQYGENVTSSPTVKKSAAFDTTQYRYAIAAGALHGLSIDDKTGVLKLNTLMALPVKDHTVKVKAFSKDNPSSPHAITDILKITLNAHSGYNTRVITARNYVGSMGVGMDVDWAKVTKGKDYYDRKTSQDFKDFGVEHVRIRVRDRVASPDEDHNNYTMSFEQRLFEYVSTVTGKETGLDQQLKDLLSIGVTPVLAYQGSEFKEDPKNQNGGMDRVLDWWKIVSERYRNLPGKLSFNLIIEVTDGLRNDADALNTLYSRAITMIRKTNPTRVIFMGPTQISNPYELGKLKLPTPAQDPYIAAEWHFFAAGPYAAGARYPDDYSDSSKRGKLVSSFWDYTKNKYASFFTKKGWTSFGKSIYDVENPSISNGEPQPKMDNGKPVLMTNEFGGTSYQRKVITDAIATAVEWSRNTGIPTWNGAWMPGNYNKSYNGISEFSIREQMGFGKFVSSKLKENGIPFAVNSDTKYYDRINKRWIVDGTIEKKNNDDLLEKTSSSILRAIIKPYDTTDVPGSSTPMSGIPRPSPTQ